MDAGALELAGAQATRDSLGLRAKAEIGIVAARLGLTGSAVPVGDDCAAIPDGDGHLLFAIEGFINAFVAADPWFAGWCGVMVNVSDIAAMGGWPIAVVDAIWAQDETAAAADPRWHEGRVRDLRNADRRGSQQSPHGAISARDRRPRARGKAPADEFRRTAGRRSRRRHRSSRGLPRALRQLAGGALRACGATARRSRAFAGSRPPPPRARGQGHQPGRHTGNRDDAGGMLRRRNRH